MSGLMETSVHLLAIAAPGAHLRTHKAHPDCGRVNALRGPRLRPASDLAPSVREPRLGHLHPIMSQTTSLASF